MSLKVKTILKFLFAVTLIVSFSGTAAISDEFVIFPAQGQSNEQLEKDKYDCYQWAKQNSGFDPMAAPKTKTAPPQQQAQQGGAVRGAARGALLGLAVGAIANEDKGNAAAAGAAAGGLMGGMRRRDQDRQQQQAEQQWAQQEAGQYQQERSKYDRAYTACLEGKGYTVK